MTSINISDLTPSSLAEIDTDEMSSIKGGVDNITIGLPSVLLEKVPQLEGIEVLALTSNVFSDIDSLSFREIRNLMTFASVVAV